jgi:Xaa-Pro aminopeptidase
MCWKSLLYLPLEKGESDMKNMDKFLSLLDGEVDGLLLTSRYSRHYCAEFDIAEGVAIVSKAGCRYFTDSRYIESAESGLKGFEVLDIAGYGYIKRINDAIADFGITALGFEENYLTVAEFNGYTANLNAKLVGMNAAIHSFRATKEDWELDRMRKAQQITDKAFT